MFETKKEKGKKKKMDKIEQNETNHSDPRIQQPKGNNYPITKLEFTNPINRYHHFFFFLKCAWINGCGSIASFSRRTRLIISYVNTFYKFRFALRLITTLPLN